jgi:predicted esterase
MSTKYKILGTILECPFMSCVKVVAQTQLFSKFDLFLNINKIHRVKAPVLIFHGEKDNVINQEHGKELYKAIPEIFKYQPEWVKDASKIFLTKIIIM